MRNPNNNTYEVQIKNWKLFLEQFYKKAHSKISLFKNHMFTFKKG